MEIKEIPTNQVYANFYQPREKFDKEQIQELAESILSNGLINPIIVKTWTKGRFMIVAGERRWRAHKVAGLKNIQAIVKTYNTDADWMVESLIENVHREDLNENERYKYLKKIMQIEKIPNINQLAKRVKINNESIRVLFEIQETRKGLLVQVNEDAKYGVIAETLSLDKKDRKKLIEKAVKNDIGQKQIREEVKILKQAPQDIKEALLDDKINIQQAESISRLKTESERGRAIKEHEAVRNIDNNIETNIVHHDKVKSQRSFDKRLVQAKNWLTSVRGNVTDTRSQLEKTFKILMIATKFLPVMDDTQKEKLEYDLNRLLETIEKSKQIAEKIQGYVEK